MTTFLNRRKGLMKKSKELSKLCGIDVCVICSSPQSSQKIDAETWPPEPSRVQEIISEYRSRSNMDREQRKVDLLDFLNSKKKELEGELRQLKRDNANSESPSTYSRLDVFSEESLRDTAAKINSILATLKDKIELRKREQSGSFCYLLDNNQTGFGMVENQNPPFSGFCSQPSNQPMEMTTEFHHIQPLASRFPAEESLQMQSGQNLFDVEASVKFPVPSHNFCDSIDVVSDEVPPFLPLWLQEPNYSSGISANMDQTDNCSMDGFFSSLVPSVQYIGTSLPPQPMLQPQFFSAQTSQMGTFALQMDQANVGFC
ncbi:MADS-box transcription factor PHERES 2-like [Aristolochia californica]|uniref:MADS-box transcription factor PHERES 2-like n=1 Tax=Aristolochia californica TaxID=171875 RepID=UPI0035DCF23B